MTSVICRKLSVTTFGFRFLLMSPVDLVGVSHFKQPHFWFGTKMLDLLGTPDSLHTTVACSSSSNLLEFVPAIVNVKVITS